MGTPFIGVFGVAFGLALPRVPSVGVGVARPPPPPAEDCSTSFGFLSAPLAFLFWVTPTVTPTITPTMTYERGDDYDRQTLGCAIPWCRLRLGGIL
jgi:hypothetical protein